MNTEYIIWRVNRQCVPTERRESEEYNSHRFTVRTVLGSGRVRRRLSLDSIAFTPPFRFDFIAVISDLLQIRLRRVFGGLRITGGWIAFIAKLKIKSYLDLKYNCFDRFVIWRPFQ